MQKLLLFLAFILFGFSCFAQKQGGVHKYTLQENGKILFSDTIQTQLSPSDIEKWLTSTFLPGKGKINNNNSLLGLVSCRVVDYLEIEKTDWKLFAMYMRYTLTFRFEDGQCFVSLQNINFLEPDNVNNAEDENNYLSAEFVLVQKKYKPIFNRKASDKIATAAYSRIDELFATIEQVLSSGN
ncbi:hypothetical protein FACS1894123_07490 [Bacteroidia bacterium]|nr:hypothetical protein FACS1894123_07490 [Bacteroidia bacterium]